MILILIVLACIGLFVAIYREKCLVKKIVPAKPLKTIEVPVKPTIPAVLLVKPVITPGVPPCKIARQEGRAFEKGQETLRRAKENYVLRNFDEALRVAKELIEEFKTAKIFGVKYKVRKTDSLWKIAKMKQHYAKGTKWGKIWWANKKIHYSIDLSTTSIVYSWCES